MPNEADAGILEFRLRGFGYLRSERRGDEIWWVQSEPTERDDSGAHYRSVPLDPAKEPENPAFDGFRAGALAVVRPLINRIEALERRLGL